jgi:hypothetical protein
MRATNPAIDHGADWTSSCLGTEVNGRVCAFYPEKQPINEGVGTCLAVIRNIVPYLDKVAVGARKFNVDRHL